MSLCKFGNKVDIMSNKMEDERVDRMKARLTRRRKTIRGEGIMAIKITL